MRLRRHAVHQPQYQNTALLPFAPATDFPRRAALHGRTSSFVSIRRYALGPPKHHAGDLHALITRQQGKPPAGTADGLSITQRSYEPGVPGPSKVRGSHDEAHRGQTLWRRQYMTSMVDADADMLADQLVFPRGSGGYPVWAYRAERVRRILQSEAPLERPTDP